MAGEFGAMSCGLWLGNVRLDSMKGMSNAEVKYMLKNCVCRQVTTLWVEESEEQPKLCVLKELVRRGFEARYVGVRRKKMRRILMKRVQQSCKWRWEMDRFEDRG